METAAPSIAETTDILPEAMKEPRPPVAGVFHTIGLLALLAISLNLQPMNGPDLAAPPPNHLWRILLVDWLVVAYVAWGLKRRGGSLRDLMGAGLLSSKGLLKDVGIALLVLFGNFVIVDYMIILLGPAHPPGYVDPTLPSLIPHGPVAVTATIMACVTAGICEEIVFRGYLQRQLVAWTKSPAAGIIVTGMIFGAGHLYHGFRGAIGIGLFSMIWGIVAMWRQNLRPLMLAHVTQDLLEVVRKV